MGTTVSLPRHAIARDVAAGLCRHFESLGLEPRRIDTHISSVVLAGDRAYKVKKAVHFGFVDFRSPLRRRRFCEEEVRLNRRLAPDLYLGVVSLHERGDAVAPDPPGPVVDSAVLMRRLPPLALAGERLARGALLTSDLTAFAERLARFQQEASVEPPGGDRATASGVVRQMRSTFEALAPALDTGTRTALQAWIDAEATRLSGWFDRRHEDGHVREGHGDLHLDNLVVLGPGETTAFDALEFDPALRWIDTQADAAFLVMDLLAHGRRDLAFGFLDDWLERNGDHEGVTGLRWYLVWRALIRALVARLRAGVAPDGGRLHTPDYVGLALRLTRRATGHLLITHGLPGSGKTHLTRALLERAGAVRLRSDVERRRLFPAPQGRYAPAATHATYAHLGMLAATLLAAGQAVIVDAAFGRRDEREALRAVAAAAGVPFTVLECRAPAAVLQARVTARQREGRDASEADLAVLESAAAREEPLGDDERADTLTVDTSQPVAVAALAHRWLARSVAPPA